MVRTFTASGNPPKPRAGILFYPPHTSTTIESASPTNLRVSGVLFNVLSSYLLPSLAMGLNYNAIKFSHRGLHQSRSSDPGAICVCLHLDQEPPSLDSAQLTYMCGNFKMRNPSLRPARDPSQRGLGRRRYKRR